MFKIYIAKHYSLLGLFSIEQNPHYVPIYLFIMSSQLANEQCIWAGMPLSNGFDSVTINHQYCHHHHRIESIVIC